MRVRSVVATVALAAAVAMPLAAQENPVQLALFTPVQLVPESQGVSVVRLNLIYSVNRSVKFIDLGFVNVTSGGPSSGVQWGGVNTAANRNGLQFGLVNYAQRLHGVQIGFINIIRQGGQFPVFPIVN